MKKVAIFGGLGFVGVHLAEYIKNNFQETEILLFDIYSLSDICDYRKKILDSSRISVHFCDVRKLINFKEHKDIDLIINLAAVHREPGHNHEEYFQTNIPGAKNICEWADMIDCKSIIFSSSIAPYGTKNNKVKDEETIPCPDSAYGSSKLAAEKIHEIWRSDDKEKKLLIVRPGVIYGPTEGGNVNRLLKILKYKFFIFTGNKDVRKAGIYIKELCHAIFWLHDKNHKNETILANLTYWPCPSLFDYISEMTKTKNTKIFNINVPYKFIYFLSVLASPLSKIFSKLNFFHPVRIQKLRRGNHIKPQTLIDYKYKWKYNFSSSFDDWLKSCKEEWN